MQGWLDDLRSAVRSIALAPAFAVAAVATLGLAIGAATALFGVADAVLLRPLPFADPDRLVALWGALAKGDPLKVEVSLAELRQWQRESRSFSRLGLIAATGSDLALTGGDEPLHVRGRLVSGELFPLLGARAALGRTLRPADDRPGAPPVIVLSHGFWQRHFAGDSRVVGRTVDLDSVPGTIVGVMPPAFRYPQEADVWTPLADIAANPKYLGLRIFEAVGRLAPGVDLAAAREEMKGLAARLDAERPAANWGYGITLTPLTHELLGDTRPALRLLLAAVVLVVLAACANVAGLLLARAAARQRETAVRTALGAGRWRLARALLCEAGLLGAAAAALGVALAWLGLGALARFGPADIPRLDEAAIDIRALGFALLATLATVALFSLAPALQAGAADLAATLREGLGTSASARVGRLRNLLVVAEIALALVLLIGAGLLLRSLANLETTELGFRSERLLTFRVTLYGEKRPGPPEWAEFFRQARERLAALPGVEEAAVVLMRPFSGPIGWEYGFATEGQSAEAAHGNPIANQERVSPGYFHALGIPLIAGRDFTWADAAAAPQVAIVNAATARRLWPGRSPLGRRLRWSASGEHPWMTVVGVAGDVHYRDLETVRTDVYVPFLQDPHWAMDLVLRTGGDPLTLAAPARAAIRAVDPDQPIAGLTTMERAISQSVARPRLRTVVLGLFAGLTLLLAAVGLYGTISYSVARRGRELGIRFALGADRGTLLRLVLGQGLRLALLGLAAGIALTAAVVSTGWLSGLLYAVEPTDSWTLATVPLFLFAVALLATLLPACRALDVDPVIALRHD